MTRTIFGALAHFAIASLFAAAPAYAAGDLLVAPTRLVLGENGGDEVLLSNKGSETATYRTSVILKKMQPDGQCVDITQPTPEQQQLIDMVSFAPRKVILAPGQTQTVRIAVRMPPSFPSGEYRVHMLFRAVPVIGQAQDTNQQSGVPITLTPVYGITIPIIVRKGTLEAKASITHIKAVQSGSKQVLTLDLARTGNRSVYGTVRLFKPGVAQPLAELKGVAVYSEIDRRSVTLTLPEAVRVSGPIIVRFNEDGDTASKASAEATITL